MTTIDLSFDQLDALYEVIEAARREYFRQDLGGDRQVEREQQLKLAYQGPSP